MKKSLMMLMVAVSMLSIATTGYAAPIAPTMTLSTQGQSLIISWTPSQGATGYKLAYAPYPWQPWMTMDDIRYADMGSATCTSFLLWEGAAYYAAVQAYDSQGSSDFSNIDYFVMGPPTPTWVDDDGDGYSEVDGDCNDADPSVRPSVDGIDQDCSRSDLNCSTIENFNGVWHDDICKEINIGVNGAVIVGGRKEIITVNNNTLTAQDITYYNHDCIGDIFNTYTYVYHLTFNGSTTTTNDELSQKILMNNTDVYLVNYHGSPIIEFADYYQKNCGFVPLVGQKVHERQCVLPETERFLGTVLYGIYQIVGNKLYINDDIYDYPTYLLKSYPHIRE